jgi:8-oxo-dGTP pyrophosphatase MutT (NUDIX family)
VVTGDRDGGDATAMSAQIQAGEIPAATVVLGRDAPGDLEVLMVRRTSSASFAAGAWVFPGGRVESEDAGPGPLEGVAAARQAAVRETAEEAGIAIDGAQLSVMSRWSPDESVKRRFLTWMLFGRAPEDAQVAVDGGEIVDHRWSTPAAVLRAHDRGEIVLLPPTWMTLTFLTRHRVCDTALAEIRSGSVEHFRSRLARTDEGPAVLWHGEAGYATRQATLPGPRHRLLMKPGAWRYERKGS